MRLHVRRVILDNIPCGLESLSRARVSVQLFAKEAGCALTVFEKPNWNVFAGPHAHPGIKRTRLWTYAWADHTRRSNGTLLRQRAHEATAHLFPPKDAYAPAVLMRLLPHAIYYSTYAIY